MLNKTDCETCRADLTQEALLDEEGELLLLHRSFDTRDGVSHLTAPSHIMTAVTDIALSVFQEHFDRLKHLPQVKASLVDIARRKIFNSARDWLRIDTPCNIHRETLLKSCMKLRIIKHVLWESRSKARVVKEQKTIASQKLKNVKNV